MAVIVLGCGVAGLSVLAYALHSIRPHPSRRLFFLPTGCKTLKTCIFASSPLLFILTHRFLVFLVSRRHFLGSTSLLNTHELQIHILPVVCASTDKNRFVLHSRAASIVCSFLTGSDCSSCTIISWVLPMWFSSADLCTVWPYPFFTVLLWCCIIAHAHPPTGRL